MTKNLAQVETLLVSGSIGCPTTTGWKEWLQGPCGVCGGPQWRPAHSLFFALYRLLHRCLFRCPRIYWWLPLESFPATDTEVRAPAHLPPWARRLTALTEIASSVPSRLVRRPPTVLFLWREDLFHKAIFLVRHYLRWPRSDQFAR